MSALDLFSLDYVHEAVAAYFAIYRPDCAVVYGTEQDAQFQGQEEERVVIGAQPEHVLGPAGPQGAPGPQTVEDGQRVAAFATLRQGCWIAIRARCAEGTSEANRVLENQRRVFRVLRSVLNAIDTAPEAHGSTSIVLGAKAALYSPETADFQDGALLVLPLSIDVPVLGENRPTFKVVESDPQEDEATPALRVEACDGTGITCQVVTETP